MSILETIEVSQGHLLSRNCDGCKEWERHYILDRQVVFECSIGKVVP